jgi:hypothetical protein
MGCIHGRETGNRNENKTLPKYNIILDDEKEKDYYINIYQNENQPDEYLISGTLSPDVKRFYIVIKKEDEERLPVAISFELSDESFLSNQYQFIKFCPTLKPIDLNNVFVQFPDQELSSVYSCEVSPSFPFAVDISGSIKLKFL